MPEALLAEGLDRCPDPALIIDGEGRIAYANPAACALSGWARKAITGLALARLLEAPGLPDGGETWLLARDGSRIPVAVHGSGLRHGGRSWQACFLRDLTARRAAEAALRRSEARYSLVASTCPDAITFSRLEDGTYLDVNAGFERATGWTREEVLGRTATELGLWAVPDEGLRIRDLLKSKGEFDGVRFQFRSRRGHLIKGQVSCRIFQMDGEPCLLTITRDITLQSDAQQALGDLTDLVTTITGHIPAFITLLDRDGRILFLNRAVSGFRTEDVIGMDFRTGISEAHRADASRALERVLAGSERETYAGWAWGAERELRWYHCILGPMTTEGRITGAVLIAADETEQRRQDERLQELGEALRQAQKLESLGVLAGGIAHDFNNLLTAIMGNLNLAQLKLPETSAALPHLTAVENTVLKASELTRQMLAYSGKGRFSVRPMDLNALVAETLHLLEVTVPRGATLRIEAAPALPAIEGDATQIQQVVMNLVHNAADALGGREGVIRLGTRVADLDPADCEAKFPAQGLGGGRYVVLEVEDTGCGMPPEVLARIFEPFFTTKVKGRGLGLSAMRGILKGHRAGLQVQSQEGRGSQFTVWFPACDLPVPVPAPPAQAPEGPFHGKVLLVDDEAVILDSISQALASLGFVVVTARDGLEAVERFEQEGDSLALVLMDLTMPRLDGASAFRRMQDLHPGVPVILSSGYDRQALEGVRPAAFAQKPYRLSDLRVLIKGVLGKG